MNTSVRNLLFGTSLSTSKIVNIAYLLFRLHVGISISIGAGLAKVFHKINDKGTDDWNNLAFGVPQWFIDQVKDIGFTFISPSFWAHLAVYGEFVGGLFIAFGLFTRLSAFQLAFQFFVVSFIWYDEPSFIVGMYYQQLFFWGFVLIAAFGGGVFSVDALIEGRVKFANKRVATILLAGILVSAMGFAQAQTPTKEVSFKFKNASILVRKLTVIAYEPGQNGNSTQAFYMMPLSTKAFKFREGTKIYLANQKQVRTVMDGNRIDSQEPFCVIKKENEGKTINF